MARGDTQEGSAKAAVHLLVKCTNIVRACTLYYKCVDNLATAVVGFQMILYYTFTHHSAVTQRFFLLVLVLVLFWGPPRFLAASSFHLARKRSPGEARRCHAGGRGIGVERAGGG